MRSGRVQVGCHGNRLEVAAICATWKQPSGSSKMKRGNGRSGPKRRLVGFTRSNNHDRPIWNMLAGEIFKSFQVHLHKLDF